MLPLSVSLCICLPKNFIFALLFANYYYVTYVLLIARFILL